MTQTASTNTRKVSISTFIFGTCLQVNKTNKPRHFISQIWLDYTIQLSKIKCPNYWPLLSMQSIQFQQIYLESIKKIHWILYKWLFSDNFFFLVYIEGFLHQELSKKIQNFRLLFSLMPNNTEKDLLNIFNTPQEAILISPNSLISSESLNNKATFWAGTKLTRSRSFLSISCFLVWIFGAKLLQNFQCLVAISLWERSISHFLGFYWKLSKTNKEMGM